MRFFFIKQYNLLTLIGRLVPVAFVILPVILCKSILFSSEGLEARIENGNRTKKMIALVVRKSLSEPNTVCGCHTPARQKARMYDFLRNDAHTQRCAGRACDGED